MQAIITDKIEQQTFGFSLFEGMQKDNLGYIYRGMFTQGITDSIISLAETNLETTGESPKVKKRVFSIMVECLQNITRHQNPEETIVTDNDSSGIFVIQKKGDHFYITTGNIVSKDDIAKLRSLLEKINSLEKEALDQYYKQVLNDGLVSNKGGAGLGLIDMAKKSGNKLLFDFEKINDDYSYFYLHTAVSKDKDEVIQQHQVDLDNIKNLHKLINSEDISLVFNGVLNQESLISLLSIIERQMAESVDLKKKVFNVMVEMLQNIVKHACKKNMTEDVNGNPGLFFLSRKNGTYALNTGNYIRNKEAVELEAKLDHVNSLADTELDVFYSKRLLNFEIDDSKQAGLGIIDLRLKSGNKLNYNFFKIDEQVTFFTLQICL